MTLVFREKGLSCAGGRKEGVEKEKRAMELTSKHKKSLLSKRGGRNPNLHAVVFLPFPGAHG